MPLITPFAQQVASVLVELDLVLDPLVAFWIRGSRDGSRVGAELGVCLAFGRLTATLLPGLGTGGFVRLDGRSVFRFLDLELLA